MTEAARAEEHQSRLSAATREMRFSAIRRMSALIERPGIISFAPASQVPRRFLQNILEGVRRLAKVVRARLQSR